MIKLSKVIFTVVFILIAILCKESQAQKKDDKSSTQQTKSSLSLLHFNGLYIGRCNGYIKVFRFFKDGLVTTASVRSKSGKPMDQETINGLFKKLNKGYAGGGTYNITQKNDDVTIDVATQFNGNVAKYWRYIAKSGLIELHTESNDPMQPSDKCNYAFQVCN